MDNAELSPFENLYADVQRLVKDQIQVRKDNLKHGTILPNLLFVMAIFVFIRSIFEVLPTMIAFVDTQFTVLESQGYTSLSFSIIFVPFLLFVVIMPFEFIERHISKRLRIPRWVGQYIILFIFPLIVAVIIYTLKSTISLQLVSFDDILKHSYNSAFVAIVWSAGLYLFYIEIVERVDDFFWILPTRMKVATSNTNPIYQYYDSITSEQGELILPFLSSRTILVGLVAKIELQQRNFDSQSQTIGGMSGILGLIGGVLSAIFIINEEPRNVLYYIVWKGFNLPFSNPQDAMIYPSTIAYIIILIILIAVLVIVLLLLRSLAAIQYNVYILGLMEHICREGLNRLPLVPRRCKRLRQPYQRKLSFFQRLRRLFS